MRKTAAWSTCMAAARVTRSGNPSPRTRSSTSTPGGRRLRSQAAEVSHGGTDLLELREFVRAVRNKTQTPIDVYDSVTMSAVIPLSEESIRKGGTPIPCPDFTRGRWQTRKPSFALCES